MFLKKERKQEELSSSDVVNTKNPTSDLNAATSKKTLTQKLREADSKKLKKGAFVVGGILGALLIVVLLSSLLFNKTYKIGTQTFTSRDISKTKNALTSAGDEVKNAGKLAEDKVILLAALKSEADARGIKYDETSVDKANTARYGEYGGKQGYMKYMKNTYEWSEKEVYQVRTIEYLQDLLKNELLQERKFTVVYSRWDNMKEFEGGNYAARYAAQEAALNNKIIPLLKQGASIEQLSAQVDISPSMAANPQKTAVAYKKSNASPMTLQEEKPSEITYTAYKEGEDPKVVFASVKKVGDTVGPTKLSDGRLLVARMEAAGQGKYQTWDEYTLAMREKVNLKDSRTNATKINLLLKHVFASINVFKAQAAYAAGGVNCEGHLNPVTYEIYLWDEEKGIPIYKNFNMSATTLRSATYCNLDGYEQDFTSAPCPVDGDTQWYCVTKQFGGTGGVTITLDCVGVDWLIGPAPTLEGYEYIDLDRTGTYANGGREVLKFNYKKKASTERTTCSLGVIDGTAVDRKRIVLSTEGPVIDEDDDPMKAQLTSSVSDGQQEMGLPNSTSQNVSPAATGYSTYTVTIYKKTIGGERVTSCSTTINNGNNNDPLSCNLVMSGNTSTYSPPYTATWSTRGPQPPGLSMSIWGSGSGNYDPVSGWPSGSKTAYYPRNPANYNNQPQTTTYTLFIQSNGSTVAQCSDTITIGGGGSTECSACGGPGCPPCDYATFDAGMYCEVNIWKLDLNKPDKKGEKMELGTGKVLNADPNQDYVVEPREEYYLNANFTQSGERRYMYVTPNHPTIPADPELTAYMYNNFTIKGTTELGGRQEIPYAGRTMRFNKSSYYAATLQTGKTDPGPFVGGPWATYGYGGAHPLANGASSCFRVIVPEQECSVGLKYVDTVFGKIGGSQSRFNRLSRYGSNQNLLKPLLKPMTDFESLGAKLDYTYQIAPGYYPAYYFSGFEYAGRAKGGAGGRDGTTSPNDGYYRGKVLIWDYNNPDKLNKGDVLVAVVFKNGVPLLKGVPLPSQYLAHGSTPSPRPAVPSTIVGGAGGGQPLPFPIDSMPSSIAYTAKDLTDAQKAFLPQRNDDMSPSGVYTSGEHWFDMAIPIAADNDVLSYTVKMYKVNMNGATGTDNFEARFDSILSADGVPNDAYKVTECGSETTTSTPTNKPYIKTEGADVFSGISFLSGDKCVATSQQKNAAIKTNGYSGARGFSGTQYAAFASGQIGAIEPNAFYGNDGYLREQDSIKYKDLLFANSLTGDTSNPRQAGKFYGNDSNGDMALPCIKVDIDDLQSKAGSTVTQANVAAAVQNNEGIIYVNGDVTLGSIDNIQKNKTLVVRGNLKITGNLTYSLGSVLEDQLPHLKIIAKNIYIMKSATDATIDAELVAFPTPKVVADGAPQEFENGIIDTCAEEATKGVWGQKLTINYCPRKLTVNGSLTAQSVLWKGTKGTVGGDATEWFTNSCIARDQTCAAEYIKSSPELYISTFNKESFSDFGKVLNSTELPPAY